MNVDITPLWAEFSGVIDSYCSSKASGKEYFSQPMAENTVTASQIFGNLHLDF